MPSRGNEVYSYARVLPSEVPALPKGIELPDNREAVSGRRHIGELAVMEWSADEDGVQRIYLRMARPDETNDFAQDEEVILSRAIVCVDQKITEDDLETVFRWVTDRVGTQLELIGEEHDPRDVEASCDAFLAAVDELTYSKDVYLSELMRADAHELFDDTGEFVTDLTEVAERTTHLQQLIAEGVITPIQLRILIEELHDLAVALEDVLEIAPSDDENTSNDEALDAEATATLVQALSA